MNVCLTFVSNTNDFLEIPSLELVDFSSDDAELAFLFCENIRYVFNKFKLQLDCHQVYIFMEEFYKLYGNLP